MKRIDGPCWVQAQNVKNGWKSEPYFLAAGYWLPLEDGNFTYAVVEKDPT